ncbi:xanthine dehydrogenase accessory protein XdhC [Rhodobacteraceae bacterium XHP0102]|nr:xanthine dehydrogenase accessory protein XdhC [Rhodobacteraceae bacterium XHP0102]
MSLDLDYLRRCAQKGAFTRILIARTAGSVPREAGTSMIVWAEGQEGTIGGGSLEWEAVTFARTMLATGGIASRTYPLGPSLGQCCGGSVTLAFEVFADDIPAALPYARALKSGAVWDARRAEAAARLRPDQSPAVMGDWLIETQPPSAHPIWIWGAGHVGRALVGVLHPLPHIVLNWVDIASDRFPQIIPENVTPLIAATPQRLAHHAPPAADHVIVTHDHALDLEICHALLGHEFGSVGLIGSATKWARFKGRLSALGHSHAQISRISCPIGDISLGKHPQAIALGVATALLSRAEETAHKQAGAQ